MIDMTLFSQKHALPAFTSVAAATGIVLFAPSAVEASFGEQTLRQGMSHPDVAELQTLLKEQGYFTHHTATGYFGDITVRAVRAYQQDHGLTVDGIVGPQTFGRLSGGGTAVQTESTSSSKPVSAEVQRTAASAIASTGTLREGSRGEGVTALQRALKDLGFFDYPTATGYYGAVTKASVMRYQRARNLTVDGIAGQATLGAVKKDLEAGRPTRTDQTEAPANVVSSVSSAVVLRDGARGERVTDLQNRLTRLGYYSGPISGTYGPRTKEAVIAFQVVHQLTPDGVAGPRTFEALKNPKPAPEKEPVQTEPETSAPAGTFTLKEGANGNEVSELQNRLKATGHFDHRVTGHFGPITKQAVQAFQGQWGLVADGVVTRSTWDKVVEISSVHMDYAQPPAASVPSDFNVINLLADASGHIGVPYQWGGVSPSGFDCSGFIQYVFKQNGVSIPRTVREQWASMTPVTTLKPGDIVFFETYTSGPSHNGIYIGNNQFIHAGSSTGVTIASLSSTYWDTRYLGAKRITR